MVAEKLLSYNRANRAVAILCNHQRAPPKTFDQSMANLQAKVGAVMKEDNWHSPVIDFKLIKRSDTRISLRFKTFSTNDD